MVGHAVQVPNKEQEEYQHLVNPLGSSKVVALVEAEAALHLGVNDGYRELVRHVQHEFAVIE